MLIANDAAIHQMPEGICADSPGSTWSFWGSAWRNHRMPDSLAVSSTPRPSESQNGQGRPPRGGAHRSRHRSAPAWSHHPTGSNPWARGGTMRPDANLRAGMHVTADGLRAHGSPVAVATTASALLWMLRGRAGMGDVVDDATTGLDSRAGGSPSPDGAIVTTGAQRPRSSSRRVSGRSSTFSTPWTRSSGSDSYRPPGLLATMPSSLDGSGHDSGPPNVRPRGLARNDTQGAVIWTAESLWPRTQGRVR